MSPTTHDQLADLLRETIGRRAMPAPLHDDTPLLGAVAELDSTALLGLLTGIETRFGVTIPDEAVNADAFRTWGALVAFVEEQVAAG